MPLSEKYRFYLPSTKDYIYSDRVRLINGVGGHKVWIYDNNQSVRKKDPDFVAEAFTGEQAVNGEIYVGDIVSYKNVNCKVGMAGTDEDPTFGVYYGDSFIPFKDIADLLEVQGDVHVGIFDGFGDPEEFSDDTNVVAEDEEEEYHPTKSNPVKTETDTPSKKPVFEENTEKSENNFDSDQKFHPSMAFTGNNIVDENNELDDEDMEDLDTSFYEPDEDDESYLGEEFQWDDEVATILEMAYTKNLRAKYDVFIRSVLDRRIGSGAWAVYIKEPNSDTETVKNSEYKGPKITPFKASKQKRLLELEAFKTALEEITIPSLIRIHSDNAFVDKFIKEDFIPAPEEVKINSQIRALMQPHQFLVIPENGPTTMVESLIAKDAAKAALANAR